MVSARNRQPGLDVVGRDEDPKTQRGRQTKVVPRGAADAAEHLAPIDGRDASPGLGRAVDAKLEPIVRQDESGAGEVEYGDRDVSGHLLTLHSRPPSGMISEACGQDLLGGSGGGVERD